LKEIFPNKGMLDTSRSPLSLELVKFEPETLDDMLPNKTLDDMLPDEAFSDEAFKETFPDEELPDTACNLLRVELELEALEDIFPEEALANEALDEDDALDDDALLFIESSSNTLPSEML
jgi:hypothetical protein